MKYLFIIGAPKAGTTALAQQLDQHKNISCSIPKEPFFFSNEFKDLSGNTPIKSYNEYLKCFPNSQEKSDCLYRLDASSLYLYSDDALNRIWELKKNEDEVKIIILTRDLVDIAYGFYMQNVNHFREERKSFYDAFFEGPNEKENTLLTDYKKIASIGSEIKKWMARYPREDVLVVDNKEMREDNEKVIAKVLDFLEIENVNLPSVVANESFSVKTKFIASIMRSRYSIVVGNKLKKMFGRDNLEWAISLKKSLYLKKSKRKDLSDFERSKIRNELQSEYLILDEIRSVYE